VNESLARGTLAETSALLQRGAVSPSEVLDSVLERADRVNPHLNAFVTVLEPQARRRARELERQPREIRERQPLWGVPISVKDNIAVAGAPTTAGSSVPLEYARDSADAATTESLLAAGAIIFAKNRLYEFAFGNQHRTHGTTKNPWRLDRTTAGSSSGSVAAVAASLGFGSIGTDTGGSIRVPAAMCGVVGLKPTLGRVPTRGVVPVSWSLDHVGPMARTVADAAAILRAISPGTEPAADPEHSPRRVGVALDGETPLDPAVRDAVREACAVLSQMYDVVEVDLPSSQLARTVLWTIASAEASDFHRHLLARHGDLYDPLVRRRLLRGRLISAADYVRAQRLRAVLTTELDSAAEGVDAVVLPVSPIPAYSLGDRRVQIGSIVEDASDAVTRFTPLFSLTGWPALSVPCGQSRDGLPLGIQIAARPGDDEVALAVAHAYEQMTPWHLLRPPEITSS
jgi:aspartyl-tRNA(Asn)/glutamyl-tRNA(Gln) amidotransferase subunit A